MNNIIYFIYFIIAFYAVWLFVKRGGGHKK